jgi:predicted RNase H-like HicB family nuclease
MEAGSEHNSFETSQGVTMTYKVELIKTEEGYTVGCPDLPGCWSEGNTEEEAIENIKDAIREYVLAQQDIEKLKEIRYVEVKAS